MNKKIQIILGVTFCIIVSIFLLNSSKNEIKFVDVNQTEYEMENDGFSIDPSDEPVLIEEEKEVVVEDEPVSKPVVVKPKPTTIKVDEPKNDVGVDFEYLFEWNNIEG